jgi:ABC-type antimicrobial peptide transport system permease subunit
MYWSTNKYALGGLTIIIRTTRPLRAQAPLLRAAVREIDPALPVFDLMTMDDGIAQSLGPRILGSRVLGAFAVLAAVLAAFGIYGLSSYTTAERTREMGIRLALGARPGQIVVLILRAAAVLTLIGAAVGVAMFLAADRALAALMFGASPQDPTTIAYGVTVLSVIALLGSSVPALRAVRVDPMKASRAD